MNESIRGTAHVQELKDQLGQIQTFIKYLSAHQLLNPRGVPLPLETGLTAQSSKPCGTAAVLVFFMHHPTTQQHTFTGFQIEQYNSNLA